MERLGGTTIVLRAFCVHQTSLDLLQRIARFRRPGRNVRVIGTISDEPLREPPASSLRPGVREQGPQPPSVARRRCAARRQNWRRVASKRNLAGVGALPAFDERALPPSAISWTRTRREPMAMARARPLVGQALATHVPVPSAGSPHFASKHREDSRPREAPLSRAWLRAAASACRSGGAARRCAAKGVEGRPARRERSVRSRVGLAREARRPRCAAAKDGGALRLQASARGR